MVGPHGNRYVCIPALCTYTADLVEQHLLTLTKSGMTERACPRCYTKTCEFHKFCDNPKLRTNEEMIMQYNHAKALVQNKQSKIAKDLLKKYSINLVKDLRKCITAYRMHFGHFQMIGLTSIPHW
ncbi:hypothetical protein BJV82DRAFT_584526 [Fennellomyces sp. T-0311]|nr:hypothetical protein BJV82DRAFT_584526 [Fennellomyces sp. T-0311]